MKNIVALLALGVLFLTACGPEIRSSVTPVITVTQQPTTTAVGVFPTPSSPGDSILWDDIQVTLDQLEVTQEYVTDFDSSRVPPDGYQFLWVHIRLLNTGQIEMNLPLLENFSVLYAAMELKPTYGHRTQYVDYSTLEAVIFPGQELAGWLRFDIPNTAELSDLRFVFLPESAQVGVSYDSPTYPYADDKPTYVWNLVP